MIEANNNPGAYWIQVRGLGECGIKRSQQLAILRYARGPYQPSSAAPTYDVGIPQGVVSTNFVCKYCHIYYILPHSRKEVVYIYLPRMGVSFLYILN